MGGAVILARPAGLPQDRSNACKVVFHKSGNPGTQKSRNPETQNLVSSGSTDREPRRDHGLGWHLGRGDNAARPPLSRHAAGNVQSRKFSGESYKPESPVARKTESMKPWMPDNPLQVQFRTGIGTGGMGHRVTPPIPTDGITSGSARHRQLNPAALGIARLGRTPRALRRMRREQP